MEKNGKRVAFNSGVLRQNAVRGTLVQFSPDGRWLACESKEAGRFEIVVQPFPAPSSKRQVILDFRTIFESEEDQLAQIVRRMS